MGAHLDQLIPADLQMCKRVIMLFGVACYAALFWQQLAPTHGKTKSQEEKSPMTSSNGCHSEIWKS